MKILSLDLSTHSSGYAIGENQKLEKHGCISFSSKAVLKRITEMRDEISKLIKDNNIEKIIAE